MAWLVRKSLAEEDSPHVHWTADELQAILKSNAEVVDRFSDLVPGHPNYLKKGDVPAGLPIRYPDRPRQAFINELKGPLPDALTSTIVNDRIKIAVESIEPAVHQFIPTTVTMPNGERDPSWWSMRPCHRVDSLAIDHCEDVHKHFPQQEKYPEWYYYRSNEGQKMKLAVKKKLVEGMAIWHDWRFNADFFCEELGRYFIDNKIRGYMLTPEESLFGSKNVVEV